MLDLTSLTTFFGWCVVLNIGMLLFATLFLVLFREFVKTTHSRMLGVPKNNLDIIYFKYLAYYKIGVIIFSVVPYLALKIMS